MKAGALALWVNAASRDDDVNAVIVGDRYAGGDRMTVLANQREETCCCCYEAS